MMRGSKFNLNRYFTTSFSYILHCNWNLKMEANKLTEEVSLCLGLEGHDVCVCIELYRNSKW